MLLSNNAHGRQIAGRAFVIFAASFFASNAVFARGLLVSPTQLGLAGKPGETISGVIYVSSSKEEQNRISTTIVDFTRAEDGSVVEAKPHDRSARSWIDLDRTNFTSPEAGRVPVTVSARIPKDAAGSYWALVYFQSEPPAREQGSSGAFIRLVPRVAIPVVVSVLGTTLPVVKIVETRAVRTADGVDMVSVVENSGNTAVLLSGAFALERAPQSSKEVEEIASASFGPLTSLPGSRLRVKSSIKFAGSQEGVQARAYLRWGPRPEDAAEGAATIEAMKSASPLAKNPKS